MNKLTDKEKEVKDFCDYVIAQFSNRILDYPEEDYSKVFIIVAFNYQCIGLLEDRDDALVFVTSDYIGNELIEDMKMSAQCLKRNKMRLANGVPENPMDKEDGEFFGCVLGILPSLRKLEGFKELIETAKETGYTVRILDENNTDH